MATTLPKPADTYARAYGCCDAVFTGLERFPIDLIRERIGADSPAALAHAMEQAWKLAVREAEQAYRQKEQGYQDTIAENRMAMAGLEQDKAFLNQALGQARGQIAESRQHIQALRQQLDIQAETLHQLAGRLTDAEKQRAGQQAVMQEQSQRWQQQQAQDQAWFARRISEEKQFAEDKHVDKLHRQSQ